MVSEFRIQKIWGFRAWGVGFKFKDFGFRVFSCSTAFFSADLLSLQTCPHEMLLEHGRIQSFRIRGLVCKVEGFNAFRRLGVGRPGTWLQLNQIPQDSSCWG